MADGKLTGIFQGLSLKFTPGVHSCYLNQYWMESPALRMLRMFFFLNVQIGSVHNDTLEQTETVELVF